MATPTRTRTPIGTTNATASVGLWLGFFATGWVGLFAALKLTGTVAVSWWVVFAPWLINGGVLALILLLVLLVAASTRTTAGRRRRR